MATAIAITALTSVGLTASLDSPFSLRIRPVLLRVDRTAMAESRASALGLDFDIRLFSLHFHFAWSAIPLFPESTKTDSSTL
jgi:hypothetical protein